jgi:hypothetical protein
MKSNQQSTPTSNLASAVTGSLKETPPHGMKGRLEPESMISADAVLVAAGMVLLVAASVSALVFAWTKYKSRAKSKTLMGDFANVPGLWAELHRSIGTIQVPRDDQARDQKSWNQFTSDMSLHLRRGVELRTQVPVAERTTEEILHLLAVGSLKIPVISEQEIKSTLRRLDAVRFGGEVMTSSDAESLLTSLRVWLERLEADQKSEIVQIVTAPPSIDEKGGVRVFDN